MIAAAKIARVIVEVFTWGPPVGDGANGAQFVTLRAVAKRNHKDAPYHVANEFVASRLAALVGLPVPAGGLLPTEDGKLAFISLFAGKRKEQPPPVIVKELVADLPYPAARIVAFDSWIGNLDRHRWNLAYTRGDVPLALFDHDDCLALNKSNMVETLRARMHEPIEGHCLAPHITDAGDLARAYRSFSEVGRKAIRGILEQAVSYELITTVEAQVALEFLLRRRERLADLVQPITPNVKQMDLGLEEQEKLP